MKIGVKSEQCKCGCKQYFPLTRIDRQFLNNIHASRHWRKIEKAKLPKALRNRKRGRPRKNND